MNFTRLTSMANTNTFVKLNTNDRPPKGGDYRPQKGGANVNSNANANVNVNANVNSNPNNNAYKSNNGQRNTNKSHQTQNNANHHSQSNDAYKTQNYRSVSNNADMSILERFPFIKLSYDKIIHTKVYAELYSIIPKGNKYYLWITYKDDKNVCLLLSISRTGTIQNIETYSLCFNDCLSYGQGTILYGTVFEVNGCKHFTCEDIYYYQGKKIEMISCINKLELLKNMFTNNINQKVYSKKSIIVGLPVYTTDIVEAQETCKTLPYKVYGIRHHSYGGIWSHGLTIVKENAEGIFKVKANIQQDIYEIYCYDKDIETPYGITLIPDYKTSVMMNKLFRNIKENNNLDLLEESDDEEEFENIREDKFVYLDKTYYMKCIYNSRFKKWQPIEVIKDKVRLITRKEANLFEQQS
jgi:hypothetical protein